MKLDKNFYIDNFKTIFYALIIAVIIRSLIIQPFYIPSSSMEPNLLIGDRLFVTKFSYGISKHSFPFSPPIIKGRLFFKQPKRGDIIVFKTPVDNRTDYVKRLIGLPGDSIQFLDGDLLINKKKIIKESVQPIENIYCGSNEPIKINTFLEKLPNGKIHHSVYRDNYSFQNSDIFNVPKNHYFFLGDNRDCSKDSRYLSSVGYVHKDNLVGKVQIIWFSLDKIKGNFFQIWKWNKSIRFNRFLKKVI